MKTKTILLSIYILQVYFTQAQPKPGEVYHEYSNHVDNKGWRVTDPDATRERARNHLPNPVHTIHIGDLENAIRAEAIIDRWGGHTETYDHRIRLNDNEWITVPPLSTTPEGHEPQMYHFHDNPMIEIPLSHLKEGDNTYTATCRGTWWGQWGMYSLILRVYYAPDSKTHVNGSIAQPTSGSTIGENPKIKIELDNASEDRITQIDVLGYYDGIDVDGDGIYQEYHCNYHQPGRGQPAVINRHIGSVTSKPYDLVWNTRYVPDQEENGIKIIARIQGTNGYWYVTDAVEDLSLVREGSTVKIYKPYDVPERFGVRQNRPVKSCKINIPESHNPDQITEATIHFRTWHGTDKQHQGFKINDWPPDSYHRIGGKGIQYVYSRFEIPTGVLKHQENTISFHSTTEHHSCEVLWPGPMIIVRYKTNSIQPSK